MPKYSIIIPVFEKKFINNCLDSIKKLNFSKDDFEVILVDNNKHKTFEKLTKKYSFNYVSEPTPGSYKARNKGANFAKSEILIFIDSDCQVEPDWLKNIDAIFTKTNPDGLMGKIQGINNNQTAFLEQKFYEEITNNFLNSEKKYLKRIDTRNFAIKKEVFKKINGFNEKLKYGGDMELGARLHEKNYQIIYSNKAIINHTNETNIYTIIKKRIKQNFDNYNIVKLHDEKFIKKYFPHLLYYKNNFSTKIIRFIFLVLLIINKFLAKINLLILPKKLKYKYFKGLNVLAIKYGLLTNVVDKKIKL